MEFLHFAFQSFWHFSGVVLLIAIVPWSMASAVRRLRGDWFDHYMKVASEKIVSDGASKTSNTPPN